MKNKRLLREADEETKNPDDENTKDVKDNDVDSEEEKREIDRLAKDEKRLKMFVKNLKLTDFNKVISEIFSDKTLSPDEKMIVVIDLHRMAGRNTSFEDIGKILGITTEYARQIYHKAEKRLIKKLKKMAIGFDEFKSYMDVHGW